MQARLRLLLVGKWVPYQLWLGLKSGHRVHLDSSRRRWRSTHQELSLAYIANGGLKEGKFNHINIVKLEGSRLHSWWPIEIGGCPEFIGGGSMHMHSLPNTHTGMGRMLPQRPIWQGQAENLGKFLCGICRKVVGRNSICSTKCKKWIHKGVMGFGIYWN